MARGNEGNDESPLDTAGSDIPRRGTERRRAERVNYSAYVEACETEGDADPPDSAFRKVDVLDISPIGIAYYSDAPPATENVLLKLGDSQDAVRVRACIVRVQEVGCGEERRFLIGCELPRGTNSGGETRRDRFATGRISFVTIALLVANLAVFGGMLAAVNNTDDWQVKEFLAWGANYAPRTMDGQLWRMITCVFVHGGFLHLAFNLWMLWNVGRMVEKLLGHFGFAVVYITSAMFASLTALFFQPLAVVVGASGAVFGLVGALFAFLILHRTSLAPKSFKNLRNNSLLFLAYNVALALVADHVDLAGHVGGCVAGFFAGLVLMQHPLDFVAGRWRRPALVAGFAAVLWCTAVMAMPSVPPDVCDEVDRFRAAERDCMRQYGDACQRLSNDALSKRAFTDMIADEILPRWQSATERLALVNHDPVAGARLHTDLIKYAQARQESWRLLVAARRTKNKTTLAMHRQKWEAAENLARRISTN